MFTPGKVTELGKRFSEDRHQLQHILSREVFAWYIREERDVKLMHVRLVPSCSTDCIMNQVNDRNDKVDLGGVQVRRKWRTVHCNVLCVNC